MTNLPKDLADRIAREIAYGREARQPDRVTAAKILALLPDTVA